MTESIEREVTQRQLKEAAAALESEREQRQRARIKEACDDWIWSSEAMCFVRRSDHLIWNDKQWRSHYATLYPTGDIYTHIMRKAGFIDKYERLCFEPGEGEIVDDAAYNLWRPSDIVAAAGDASWLLDHIDYLFPEKEVGELVLDFMALLVREPWTKILFALLIYGPKHGTGKTALSELLKRMIGAHNVATPTNEEMSGTFTSWQEGKQLVIVNELMMFGRQEVANRLKTDITEPELRIRAMYRAHYSTPNRLNFFCSTNHANALKLENADRRWFVAHSPVSPRSDAYYRELFAHISSDADVAAAKYLLVTRKVKMNPKGRAPITDAKRAMIEQAMLDPEAYIMELFDEARAPLDIDLVRRDDLIDAVQQRFPGSHKDLMGRVDTVLKKRIGAVRHSRNTNPLSRHPKYHLYSVRNHDHWITVGPTARIEAYMSRKKVLVVDDFEEEDGVENNWGY